MDPNSISIPPADILIVDDIPANLQVLTEIIKEKGHKTRPVPSGKLALQAVRNTPPDLILLDINMPEMNGYEVCAHLKTDETLQAIPVIFISALTETVDKVRGFSVGGVDYITKPFQREEVLARVDTHLTIHRQKRELEESYRRLRELEELRDSLTQMIVHDLRSPLTGILGYLELLDMKPDLDEKNRKLVANARESSEIMINMINSLIDISRLEAGQMPLKMEEYDLRKITEKAVSSLGALVMEHPVEIHSPPDPLWIDCDREIIGRVIANLTGNALKYTPRGQKVDIRFFPGNHGLRLSVQDYGPGIPHKFQEKIFTKFGQVETRRDGKKYSSGLGLTFCKLAVEAHGGTIGVESEAGHGAVFWFELPKKG
jgi:signal transduction histidine kinase